MNAYIVFESLNRYDDPIPFAVYLDEAKCNGFIEEHNRAWIEQRYLEEECYDCTKRYSCGLADDIEFLNKDSCGRCQIKEDRHGLYCVNDMNDGRSDAPHYDKYVVRLIE